MPNIEAIVQQINRDLVPEFEKKLRAYLVDQEEDWLIDQIVRLTLDAHSLEARDRQHFSEGQSQKKRERSERLRKLNLDLKQLRAFVKRYGDYGRERLLQEKLLSKDAHPKGREMITAEFRSADGNELLQLAKDLLFGFLFGDETTHTHLPRTQRQLLTLTVPRSKAGALDFMKATMEFHARGTWQDPEGSAREVQSDNIVLEVEYGETDDQAIGAAILTALRLINDLEINEEVLYGRMQKIEHSTLIS